MRKLSYGLFAAVSMFAITANAETSWDDFIAKAKPIIDYRLRYENVHQVGVAKNADALTSRLRAGVETGPLFDTKVLAEFTWTAPISEKYNSTINGRGTYAVVADPKGAELNRLQLTNTSLPGTTITVGRQRVNLDDQRFVGSVGWRDTEQRLDAVRVQNKSIPNLMLDAIYSIQTNRVFGEKSLVGQVEGDTVLLNAGYKTPFGTLSGFGYWVEFENAAMLGLSSQTFGVRFAGSHKFDPVTVKYALSYANQKDAYANPINYSADYYLLEGGLEYMGFAATGGYEVLGAGNGQSFQTPLATLHKFNGWADKFLTTPVNGLADLYGSVGYTMKKVGPFSSIGVMAVYHQFDADRGNLNYGDEIDLQLQAKISKITFLVKYADYNAKGLFTDTSKFWLAMDYAF